MRLFMPKANVLIFILFYFILFEVLVIKFKLHPFYTYYKEHLIIYSF